MPVLLLLFTEVKKQAEMADDLQTQHGRRLVHSYFHQWTEKTRQMQKAKELRDRTVLKRSVDIKLFVFGLDIFVDLVPGYVFNCFVTSVVLLSIF